MSAKYQNRKTQVLNDVYRKEGVKLMEENDFEGAVSKFNEVSLIIICKVFKTKYVIYICQSHLNKQLKRIHDTENRKQYPPLLAL